MPGADRLRRHSTGGAARARAGQKTLLSHLDESLKCDPPRKSRRPLLGTSPVEAGGIQRCTKSANIYR